MNPFHKFKNNLLIFLFTVVLLFGMANFASSEETYVFERMWPTLQQPWYFKDPSGIIADIDNYIYIADFP